MKVFDDRTVSPRQRVFASFVEASVVVDDDLAVLCGHHLFPDVFVARQLLKVSADASEARNVPNIHLEHDDDPELVGDRPCVEEAACPFFRDLQH